MQSGTAETASDADTAFSLEIARLIFGEPAAESRARLEDVDIERFHVWLAQASVETMHAHCAAIDREFVAKLSGPGLLRVARQIERRFPDMIENMPTLWRHSEQIRRAESMAQVFMPHSLQMLARALEAEGNP